MGVKQVIQEAPDYWNTLEENLLVLEHYVNKLWGYSDTSEAAQISTINDIILDLQILAKEMVDELVEVGTDG